MTKKSKIMIHLLRSNRNSFIIKTNKRMKSIFSLAAICLSLTFVPAVVGEVMTIKSKNGDELIVTLLAKQGDKILIRRAKDKKEFAISPDSLSEESKKKILAKLESLDVSYPPLDSVISVSKRRRHDNDSHYMKAMTISAKVTVTNEDHKIPCPTCKANIIFLGQDQKYTKKFMVLSNQQVDITPTEHGYTFTSEPFITKYDSDNKGEGNIGGYKYVGYLLVVSSEDGKVLHTKTVYPRIKKALEMSATKASEMKALTGRTILNEEMNKPESKKATKVISPH